MRKSNHFCRRSLAVRNIRIKLIPFFISNHQDFEEIHATDDDKKTLVREELNLHFAMLSLFS
jgi:hypothetical protein